MYALKQRVHPTWMFTALCAGFLLGAGMSLYITPVGLPVVLASVLMLVMAMLKRRAWMLVLAFLAGMGMGLWRGGFELINLSVVGGLNNKNVTLNGMVSDDPIFKRGSLTFKLTNIKHEGSGLPGEVYVATKQDIKLSMGDTVFIKGMLSMDADSLTVKMFDADIIDSAKSKDLIIQARDAFASLIKSSITVPAASLGLGILAGQKSELPSDLNDALKVAGLTHIVVASGFNLTILVRLARRLFCKISRYQSVLWSLLLILGFITITGWSASMTRAGLVAALSLWAWYFGRKFHPVTLILFVAAITVLVRPAYIWGDIGWMLSFAAFAGVLILAPLLQVYFYGQQKPSFIAQILIETMSAQIVTAPIMLGVFGQLSIVALLSNLMILPLVPSAMLVTFIAGIMQIILPGLNVVSAVAQALLNYFVGVTHWTASFDWAQVKFQIPPLAVGISYLVLLGICITIQRITSYKLRQVNVVE